MAGRFYARDPHTLEAEIRDFLDSAEPPTKAIGCIVPHAGHIYSGHVAGAVFGSVQIPQRTIILCPNHTGMGHPLAMMSEGSWLTPLGEVRIDSRLAHDLKRCFSPLGEDEVAHHAEHAIEVQLPFLQLRKPGISFVPIAIGTSKFEVLAALGSAMAEVIVAQADPVLIVASSDMNHYESDDVTRVKDQRAIEPMLRLDARGLFGVVMEEHVSMCGFGPAVAMITAAVALGARSAEVIKYATSGDVSGDRRMVVGYAGIVVQ